MQGYRINTLHLKTCSPVVPKSTECYRDVNLILCVKSSAQCQRQSPGDRDNNEPKLNNLHP